MGYKSTKEVGAILGVSPSRLLKAIWDGRLDGPVNRMGHVFCWTEAEIERASWVLLHRGANLAPALASDGEATPAV